MKTRRSTRSASRPGIVLIAVLVVTVLLSLTAYQFSELMLQEYAAAASSLKSQQARALADSGVYQVAAMLADKDTLTGTLANNPYDNQAAFGGIQVPGNAEGNLIGRFSIIGPPDPDQTTSSQTIRYGVTDEAGKLNINALVQIDSTGQVAHDALMKLPNMTEDIADAIIDWIDADDNPRPNGAESSTYSGMQPPYRAKNGPLDSIEELLLVRGVTPRLLFGTDYNRNGIQDPGEDDGSGWDPGWAAYLTVYSREQNLDVDRNPRIFLNDSNLKNLHDSLTTAVGQQLADFIILYRTQGGTGSTGSQSTGGGVAMQSATPVQASVTMSGGTSGGKSNVTIVLTPAPSGGQKSGNQSSNSSRPPTQATAQQISDKVNQVLSSNSNSSQLRSLSSRYDLIGASVTYTVGNGRNQQTLKVNSPLTDSSMAQMLPTLLDKTTTQNMGELPARVNVLTASAAVLAALPGLTDTDVQAIVAARPAPGDATDLAHTTPAWLKLDAKLDDTKMKALERYVTSRTQVYRVQSVGYFDQGGPTARVEAVIDTNGGKPRIVMWRDLSDLGKGYDLTQQQ